MNCHRFPRIPSSFGRSLFVVAFLVFWSVLIHAQVPAEPVKSPEKNPAEAAKTGPEPDSSGPGPTRSPVDSAKSTKPVLARIERARALIAAHRLDIAVGELESIRSSANDNAFRNIASIMLMSVYLEEGNYGRAEAMLEENFQARSAQQDELLGTYFALAGQTVNGARQHLARYRAFGISTSDTKLPPEAVSDLNRLRSLLERMIAQAKEISERRRAYDSLSLLEDVLGLRLSLAKDSEDQARWESEYAGARAALASSQTQIASLGGIPPLRPGKNAVEGLPVPSPYSTKRVSETPPEVKAANSESSSAQPSPASAAKTSQPDSDDAGSLNAFAIKRVVPRYPPLAKQSGAKGLVRVYVIVEGGKVVAVSSSEGPMLLRQAAEDAARQWSFQTVSIEGRPTRLSGYIDFNFTL